MPAFIYLFFSFILFSGTLDRFIHVLKIIPLHLKRLQRSQIDRASTCRERERCETWTSTVHLHEKSDFKWTNNTLRMPVAHLSTHYSVEKRKRCVMFLSYRVTYHTSARHSSVLFVARQAQFKQDSPFHRHHHYYYYCFDFSSVTRTISYRYDSS